MCVCVCMQANNHIIHNATSTGRAHIVTTSIEHDSIVQPLRQLHDAGKCGWVTPLAASHSRFPCAELTVVGVNRLSGAVDVADVLDAIRPDTTLVSVMWA